MKNLTDKIRTFVFSTATFFIISILYVSAKIVFASSDIPVDYAGPAENLFNLRIPKGLHFAGEIIPQNDYSIKENMERVFAGGKFEKSTAYILFSRAAQWFPMIEKTLKRNKIPDDFKYIALAESRLTNSISSQGAVGFWQFIASTARNYGLEVTDEVDERYSIEKSTEAACKFFKEAHQRFGNWTLSAAAFNLGMGGIEWHLKKQAAKSYYDLMMNEETSNYVYQILALKTVFINSGKKNHGGGTNFYTIPAVILKIDSSIGNLTAFAASKGYSYDILKTFNPWLLTNSLSNPEKKTYLIRFPKKEYLKKLALEINSVPVKPDSLLPKEIKSDSLPSKPDSSKEEKSLTVPSKKSTDKNEQSH